MASQSASRLQAGVAIAFVPQNSPDQGFSRESDAFGGDIDCDPDSVSIGGHCRGPALPAALGDFGKVGLIY